jgi:hypothetical protein
MQLSIVINSAALGPKSRTALSSGGVPYGKRAALLREQILPDALRTAAEVIVSGEWEPADAYRYVPCPSTHFDCTDALDQREAGFRACGGDIVVFQHDDHMWDMASLDRLIELYAADETWDVLVPARWGTDAGTQRRLNNGAREAYVMGHACVMRRPAIERAPWSGVPRVLTWDVAHTGILVAGGARIRWVEDVRVQDLEADLGARPW